MAVPIEVAKQIRNLNAAAELLGRISDERGDKEQGTQDARTIISAFAHVSHVKRWAWNIVREVLDELADADAAEAAASRGGRR